jgi:hypothetical protein
MLTLMCVNACTNEIWENYRLCLISQLTYLECKKYACL